MMVLPIGRSWPTRRLTLTAASLATALLCSAAFAAGGGGGGWSDSTDDTSKSGSQTKGQKQSHDDMTTCDKGKVWDTKKKVCVTKHSGVLPDNQLTDYAYALAKAARYQEAIETLDLLQNPVTPRALNYRGYATRKLGRTEEGIHYYLQSVELDPHYVQVREYLGEAYVTLGKFDLAKEQLGAIKELCGSDSCEYYADLAAALAKADAL